ncbi:DUF1804 family protein [Providencia hangzhouensis]|uniref:DUF1804 family protein n=1 Tax=Providencia hangzhouensis TaxID=3031799 RepID=UPI0030D2F8B9
MAHPPEMRDKLRRAYVFDGLSLEVASMQCGIAYSTAQRWKNNAAETGDDWDKLKSARLMSGGGLEEIARAMLTGLVTQFKTTMDELTYGETKLPPEERVKLLGSLSDAYNKAIASSRKVLPETSQLATAIEVVELLSFFIKENYPQHLQVFADILEPFGQEITKKYG